MKKKKKKGKKKKKKKKGKKKEEKKNKEVEKNEKEEDKKKEEEKNEKEEKQKTKRRRRRRRRIRRRRRRRRYLFVHDNAEIMSVLMTVVLMCLMLLNVSCVVSYVCCLLHFSWTTEQDSEEGKGSSKCWALSQHGLSTILWVFCQGATMPPLRPSSTASLPSTLPRPASRAGAGSRAQR